MNDGRSDKSWVSRIPRNTRLYGGVLATALVPAISVSASSHLVSGPVNQLLMFLLVWYPISLGTTIVIGGLAFLALHRLKLVALLPALAMGALGGAIVTSVIRFPIRPLLQDYTGTVPIGVATAFAGWLAWKAWVHGE